ncbi:AraC family transcriptional regulator [Enterococcus sp. LJL120]
MANKSFQDVFFRDDYFKDINFFNIGHEICSPSHRFGPAARAYYLIHLVVKGQGTYQNERITYQLQAGDFFIIKPQELTKYQADATNPWEYYWIGFLGTEVANLLRLNGFGELDYLGKVLDLAGTTAKFQELLDLDLFDNGQRLRTQALFLELLSQFKLNRLPLFPEKIAKQSRYRDSFLLYIQSNYYRSELSVQEIAKSMYLHPAYFSQVIKAELGVTPQQYLISYRMEQARFLLKTSDSSIDEIAELIGYDNRHSFSRAFKTYHGTSPSEFKALTES